MASPLWIGHPITPNLLPPVSWTLVRDLFGTSELGSKRLAWLEWLVRTKQLQVDEAVEMPHATRE